MDRIVFIIINRGKSNIILRKAKNCGLSEGTILLSEGAIKNRFLDKLGLVEVHKEILMFSVSQSLRDKLYSETLSYINKNKGIAFSIPFMRWQSDSHETKSIPEAKSSYYCLIIIIDRGQSKACIKAARAAGAKGATVIHGHGAGVPADYYFPLVIEPQKDIVMIITNQEMVSMIRQRIFNDLGLENAGTGIIFTLPVSLPDAFTPKGLKETRQKKS